MALDRRDRQPLTPLVHDEPPGQKTPPPPPPSVEPQDEKVAFQPPLEAVGGEVHQHKGLPLHLVRLRRTLDSPESPD